MANELLINHTSGSTLYALLFNAIGQIWNGNSFVEPGSAAWTDYDIAMSEVDVATGIYRGTMPAAVAGVYSLVVRKQAGGVPAATDGTVGVGSVEWNGTAEVMTSLETPQQVRDAMMLAPSAGAAAAGSVDDHLDDLAAALAEATTNVTVVSAVDGGTMTMYRAARFSAALTGLSIPADWTAMLWTVKTSTGQADTEAVLQILASNPADEQADGLLYLNGVAGTAADGSLTVNQAAGSVTIWVADSASAEIEMMTGLPWSLKALTDTEGDSRLVAVGTLNIIEQATATVELP